MGVAEDCNRPIGYECLSRLRLSSDKILCYCVCLKHVHFQLQRPSVSKSDALVRVTKKIFNVLTVPSDFLSSCLGIVKKALKRIKMI